MNWEFTSTDWNLVIAAVTAFGGLAAAYAAFLSRQTAAKSLQLQSRMNAYESLKNCAERANGYAKGKQGSDWTFHDGANIVRSLRQAMKIIQDYSEYSDNKEREELKEYFINQINMELFEELNHQNAPGAFFKGTGDSSVEVNIYEQWKDIVSFFNLMVATDADLADSRSE
ncbi:hypothetical protein H8M20_03150 [Klebsiella pneumoniae]|uniref:hypothetical protein n=1 Tax=Klebsiella pneumoniae TaxID=573 RepID=UPI00164C1DCD|nr:hypothetical protein [Klebsiella pneumoniae]HBR3171094.1 hypothetical protein [Klebsiella pneumoniae]HDU5656973.1 hypothetical protein [Klebsiella pneumoniae subsp. pneumoniae]